MWVGAQGTGRWSGLSLVFGGAGLGWADAACAVGAAGTQGTLGTRFERFRPVHRVANQFLTAQPSPPALPPACLPACRYKIEQELGTEIKPIPPVIEKGLYCA
jgi:hypothetical protein